MASRENNTGVFETPPDPDLSDLFLTQMRQAALALQCHSVARVVSTDLQPQGYDPATLRCSVAVEILQIVRDNFTPATGAVPNPTAIQSPVVLKNIPVGVYRTARGRFTLPIDVGDTGELHIQDRSIDLWMKFGVPTDPVSAFIHMMGDSVFHPTLTPDTQPLVPPATNDATTIDGNPFLNLGPAAIRGVARLEDDVAASSAMVTWAGLVETAINALATGTFTPANNFATNVAAQMGEVASASTKVRSE